jgi:pimeloyl-ACP methyl ester carboxylesterase
LHITEWGQGEPVLLVHGTRSWGTRSFAAQEPLGERGYRLLVLDRRGYGASPDTPTEDFEQDARDLVDVLAEGAHLVAHSYGGVGALLAAAARPEAIRSLALLEPAALALVRDQPSVVRFIRDVEEFYASPTWTTPEEFAVASAEAVGEDIEPPLLTPDERRALTTAMAGRHVWEARIPAEKLVDAPFPSLVVTGGLPASSAKGQRVRDALLAAAAATAQLLGAEQLHVEDAGHSPHSERPGEVNSALLRLWGQSLP